MCTSTHFTHCAVCRRPLTDRRTKPRWAFEKDYRLAGRVHTGCAQHWGHAWTSDETDPAAAQFYVWLVHDDTNGDPAQSRANVLALCDPTHRAPGPISAAQQERLDWWQHGPMQLSAAEADAARRALQELLEHFQAAGLPSIPADARGGNSP